MTRTMIGQGQDSGEIRTNIDTEHAATLVEAALFKTLVIWLMEGGSIEELHAEMSAKLDIIFDGMAPRTNVAKTSTSRRNKARG